MRHRLATLIREPRIAAAPGPMARDWAIVAAMIIGAVVEVGVRDDLNWPIPSLVLGAFVAVLMPWRRTHSLVAITAGFGAISAFDWVIFAAERGTYNLYSVAPVLLLLYATWRWGSGREMALSLVPVTSAYVAGTITDYTGPSDLIGGLIILAITAEAGLLVRGFEASRAQQVTEAKLRERQELARELHDTVAHHVSAITIQAQAGRFLASQENLTGAADALEVIEEEASRALSEMRSMIETLREQEAAIELTPQQGIRAITHFAAPRSAESPAIDVELLGDFDELPAAVHAATFRLAQESITNAVRHARRASRVEVRVEGEPALVRLTVTDDGEPVRADGTATGFGLVGMAERAQLLGGTLRAGPRVDRGWQVEALLPRTAGAA